MLGLTILSVLNSARMSRKLLQRLATCQLSLAKFFFGKDKRLGSDNSSAGTVDILSGVTTSLTKLGERLAVIQLFRDRM